VRHTGRVLLRQSRPASRCCARCSVPRPRDHVQPVYSTRYVGIRVFKAQLVGPFTCCQLLAIRFGVAGSSSEIVGHSVLS
jgi:hypothetical protein